jgi:hypothetical protein
VIDGRTRPTAVLDDPVVESDLDGNERGADGASDRGDAELSDR